MGIKVPASRHNLVYNVNTQLLHVGVEVDTGDGVPVPLEVALQRWVLLKATQRVSMYTTITWRALLYMGLLLVVLHAI